MYIMYAHTCIHTHIYMCMYICIVIWNTRHRDIAFMIISLCNLLPKIQQDDLLVNLFFLLVQVIIQVSVISILLTFKGWSLE